MKGKFYEAESLFRESLAIRKEVFGEQHPDVAKSLNNLAGLWEEQVRFGFDDTSENFLCTSVKYGPRISALLLVCDGSRVN